MINQDSWLNPRKDFLNYGKRLKTTYRYFGWYLINKLINAFQQDKANYEEFKQLPFHIYEVSEEEEMPGMCGFMPGLFTSLYNLNMTKKIGEDKNGIKTIMLVNFGTTIGYFYNQFIFLKKNGIDVADYLKSTSMLEPSSNKEIPSIRMHSRYGDVVSACIERFQTLIKEANNSCVTSIYDHREAIEDIYGFEINEQFLPPRPVSDIIAYTESLIADMEDRIDDENDLVC